MRQELKYIAKPMPGETTHIDLNHDPGAVFAFWRHRYKQATGRRRRQTIARFSESFGVDAELGELMLRGLIPCTTEADGTLVFTVP
jgi:hypothetical protein